MLADFATPFAASVTAFLVAAACGGMVFFGAVVAPVVFRTLDEREAGRLIRAMFPRYYLVLAVVSALAAFTALMAELWLAVPVLAAVATGFIYARFGLMPRINELRDRALAGDMEAQAGFDRLHRLSVRLNMGQLAALVASFAIVVWR